MSYITVKSRLCDIIVLNVPAPTEDNDDVIKDSFYEELEQVFDQFPEYHMKMERVEVFTGFWLGGPKLGDHWEDLGIGGRITLRWTLGR
jgi:hypothetical protein